MFLDCIERRIPGGWVHTLNYDHWNFCGVQQIAIPLRLYTIKCIACPNNRPVGHQTLVQRLVVFLLPPEKTHSCCGKQKCWNLLKEKEAERVWDRDSLVTINEETSLVSNERIRPMQQKRVWGCFMTNCAYQRTWLPLYCKRMYTRTITNLLQYQRRFQISFIDRDGFF